MASDTLTWRLYSRDPNGEESVTLASTRQEALARARELLVEGKVIIRVESEDGEILEGKQLQEALTARTDRSKMH